MVTFNGRITLPSHVRKQLGLKTGDSVDFVEIGTGRFAITPGAGAIPDPKGWIPTCFSALVPHERLRGAQTQTRIPTDGMRGVTKLKFGRKRKAA
jgi:AbrB family looped-hinge helix DNA binding protein